ncbi:hypothetical protein [Roseomonas indoligenes]|uniref:Entericidin EcnAB n=1 Tax=Roseomonas indoligenes TaxID=2820811 RepID=A0A940MQM5_9PROT|nr:hypothetical protein [Pararoseomonas indoligenes]MBP0491689.1 hypothetical protein [Pararoseomonas indoligenes]
MRRPLPFLLPLVAAQLLLACSPDTGERAGRSMDRAAERTGDALGGAARDTGAALNRAGNWVGDRVEPGRR